MFPNSTWCNKSHLKILFCHEVIFILTSKSQPEIMDGQNFKHDFLKVLCFTLSPVFEKHIILIPLENNVGTSALFRWNSAE